MEQRQRKMNAMRARRARRTRAKVRGTAARPRLSVARTAKYLSAQLIDDTTGRTLVAASDLGMDKKDAAAIRKGAGDRAGKVALAYEVGRRIAEAAKKAGITQVVFDRGSFAYHGRVKAVAEAARENGLNF